MAKCEWISMLCGFVVLILAAFAICAMGDISSPAIVGQLFKSTVAGSATDLDGDIITYSIVSGPSWLLMDADGKVFGTPTEDNIGENIWVVKASDSEDASSTATMITVVYSVENIIITY